tara:strand:- start:278 stop:1072 length:795 start_codon:yes stop_codon:yes gene_type:complete
LKKKIKVSVIITAEKKERFIERSINSCLDQSYGNVEIIVAYTNLKNITFLKKNFLRKNVIFLRIKKKMKVSTQDQLFKIYKSLAASKGQYIFLMDGDDCFKKWKIKRIITKVHKLNVLSLDSFHEIHNKEIKNMKTSILKKNKIYKTLINPWPKDICTSCISLDRRLLIEFFNKIKIKNFKYVAVDALLVIYFNIKNKFLKTEKVMTEKYNVKDSVDSYFIGIFNKFFWLRRLEQHNFYNSLIKKKNINLDFILTKFITFLIKK